MKNEQSTHGARNPQNIYLKSRESIRQRIREWSYCQFLARIASSPTQRGHVFNLNSISSNSHLRVNRIPIAKSTKRNRLRAKVLVNSVLVDLNSVAALAGQMDANATNRS